jgi:DNA polymerase-3 subunit alpha
MKKEKEHIGIYLTAHPLDEFSFELDQIKTLPIAELNKDSKALVNRDFTFAGLVSNSFEKRTAKNTLYGGITIEDFSDSYNLRLFSSDYMKFRNFFQDDYLLLIRATMEFWEKRQSYNIKVKEIKELSTLKDDYFKEINLQVLTNHINQTFTNELVKIIEKEKGDIGLNISLFNPVNKTRVDMVSRKYRVKLTDELIDFVKNNPAIHAFTLK